MPSMIERLRQLCQFECRAISHLNVEQEDVISDIALDEANCRVAIWTGDDVKFWPPQNGSQDGKRSQITTHVQDSPLSKFRRRSFGGSQHMSWVENKNYQSERGLICSEALFSL
jgi:hypothetical protein